MEVQRLCDPQRARGLKPASLAPEPRLCQGSRDVATRQVSNGSPIRLRACPHVGERCGGVGTTEAQALSPTMNGQTSHPRWWWGREQVHRKARRCVYLHNKPITKAVLEGMSFSTPRLLWMLADPLNGFGALWPPKGPCRPPPAPLSPRLSAQSAIDPSTQGT